MVESNTIAKIFILVVALLLAVLIGSLLVTDQFVALACVGGGAVLAFCFWLGKDIWLLIPFSYLLSLQFPWLPGGLPPSQICVLIATAWFLFLLAMRKVRLQIRITSLEISAFLVLLSVLQVYLRNPVGLAVFGSDLIGARPYFNVAVAAMGGVLLGTVVVTPEKIRSAMHWMLAGGIISFCLNIIPFIAPSLIPITGRLYGAMGGYRELQPGMPMVQEAGNAGRIMPATEIGILLSRWLSSRMNPLKKLLHPFWLMMILTSVAAVAFGGFRSGFAAVVFNFAFGTFYWGRLGSFITGAFLGATAVALVAFINLLAPLPPNVQRTLSFLPGTWEKRIVEDAEGSTAWRVEMWKEALTTDRYIHNKMLGDGLGFSARELAAQKLMEGLQASGASGFDVQRDYVLVTGEYHSGLVQTIRVTGYVGLVLLLAAMTLNAVRAHRLIARVRGTQYFVVVCFFCIPMVWHPIFFTFVYGAFGTDLPLLLINMGFLRMMENNLLPAITSAATERKVPAAGSARPGGHLAPVRA